MKFIFILLIFCFSIGYGQNISIDYSSKHPITTAAIQDFCQLLRSANRNIHFYSTQTSIHIQIQTPDTLSFSTNNEKENFKWEITHHTNQTTLILTSGSEKGIANGLYALLQEKLGFYFFHPKQTHIPKLEKFDFQTLSSFSGEKSFEHIGFHLHTMHPIELTEDLLDESRKDGWVHVKEYIDWLARNGQNYFEFNLLEGINRKSWILYAQKITEYAHSKGIQCGIDISLHMLQQKAFQLYTHFPHSFRSPLQQVRKNAEWLLQAGFDIWNIELSATEYTSGNAQKKTTILVELQKIVRNQVKIMSRAHVVQASAMLNKKATLILPLQHGVMIHTVMFYGLTDSLAPVYRNKNLLHMRDLMLQVKQERETWYYPESAYWVTFDSSVPMLLLPYLRARLKDIQFCDSIKIDGHITFSSGWEWGYWAIDWSIARWCWKYQTQNTPENQYATQYIESISTQKPFQYFIQKQEELQQKYIKEQELIRVLDAQTITDEIIKPFNIEFHPRPIFSYKYIRNHASLLELDSIKTLYIKPLKEFIAQSKISFRNIYAFSEEEKEIYDALKITELRAQHRLHTLNYLVSFRENKLNKKKPKVSIIEAEKVRKEALIIVKRREEKYRYSMQELRSKHTDHTAYHFGYLFPVHQLHFWLREERQAVKNKYKIGFMNIWKVFRIIGIIN